MIASKETLLAEKCHDKDLLQQIFANHQDTHSPSTFHRFFTAIEIAKKSGNIEYIKVNLNALFNTELITKDDKKTAITNVLKAAAKADQNQADSVMGLIAKAAGQNSQLKEMINDIIMSAYIDTLDPNNAEYRQSVAVIKCISQAIIRDGFKGVLTQNNLDKIKDSSIYKASNAEEANKRFNANYSYTQEKNSAQKVRFAKDEKSTVCNHSRKRPESAAFSSEALDARLNQRVRSLSQSLDGCHKLSDQDSTYPPSAKKSRTTSLI